LYKYTECYTTNRYIDYTYGAGGNLIRKQSFDNATLVKTTDYIGGFVYEDGTLAYFGMSECRVRNASGTLTNEYMIKDQQGNVRVSFENNAGTALVRQENSYYPFGLTMPGSVTPTAANKNLYNGGSEWQDDFGNLPDLQQTFYRNYDAALGRFIGVDPVAEAADDMSTYHYAANNPVMFNDPLGDQVNESENYSDYEAVYFHRGYKRIGHASGNHWSNELDAPPLGPFAEFWSDFLTSAVDGRHSGSFSGGAISSIYNIWSGLANGEGFGIDYRDDGSVGVQTNRYTASSDGSGYSNITIAGANHIIKKPEWDLNGDGKPSLPEANYWYRNGKGKSMNILASVVDLSKVDPNIFYGKEGKPIVVKLLKSNFFTDGTVFGTINVVYEGGNQVSILPNMYDFDTGAPKHPWFKSVEGFARNVFTELASALPTAFGIFKGTPYMINFSGTASLRSYPRSFDISVASALGF